MPFSNIFIDQKHNSYCKMLAKIKTKIGQKAQSLLHYGAKPLGKRASLAQASLEYLLTYGWALILIATIVGILFFIFWTPSGYACSGTGDLICRALGAEGEDLVLSFQNKLPFDIIINPYTGIRFDGRAGYASIKYRGKTYRFEDVTIAKADTFQVTGIGLGDASNISITYKETATGFTKEWTGGTTTPQKEVCNNGIPDAGGPTDALNPECETATYVLKATVGSTATEAFTVAAGFPAKFYFAVNDLTNMDGKLDAGYRSKTQFESVKFSFFITGNAPSNITFNNNFSGAVTPTTFVRGWNTVTLTTTNELMETPYIELQRNTADFTIAATGSANAPKLTITTRQQTPPPP
jgi:uncharacterized protein (UPF0333 family)